MKLRCEKNSLRFRLRRSEIEELRNAGSVRTDVYFSTGLGFGYELWMSGNVGEITATSYGGYISVEIPTAIAVEWMGSDQVALEHFQKIDRDQTLHILIEKDFPCKDRPDEDKKDFFVELADKPGSLC